MEKTNWKQNPPKPALGACGRRWGGSLPNGEEVFLADLGQGWFEVASKQETSGRNPGG